MEFPLENCIVTDQHFSAPQVQELLHYPHGLTWVLLDLQLLDKKVNKQGKERAIINNLSREELDRLNTFTRAQRKREWLGGRFAAKYTAARLFERIESQKNVLHWSSYTIIADENGRPFLSTSKEDIIQHCDISISHSGSLAAAMAAHKGYCGIDIQQVTPKVIKVRDRFCTLDEKQIIENFFPVELEKQAASLTKLWAAKEALRKASYLRFLPGFLELELIEITADPLQEKAGPWTFIFNWKNPDGFTHKTCRVAVAQVEDYALALTAMDDTVGSR